MTEEWAKTVAQKIENRPVEEAERAGTLRKRFEEGVERFRRQVLDLVAGVNEKIATEASRIQVIVLDDGIVLAAAYKRIVTMEEMGVVPGVPACVGKIVLHVEDRRATAGPEPREMFVTSAGTQTTFYHYVGKDLKICGEADFKHIVEHFAT